MTKSRVLIAVLACGLAVAPTAACSSEDTPAAAPTSSAPAPAPSTAAPATSPSEGVVFTDGVNTEITGLVTLLAPGSILVEAEGGDAQEAYLAQDTEVLDVQGSVCTTGALPHRCTPDQLEKALEKDVQEGFYAKVTVRNGIATRIEEIVRN